MPHAPHRQYLYRKIAWELQAREEGRLPEETRQYALAIAREAKLGGADRSECVPAS